MWLHRLVGGWSQQSLIKPSMSRVRVDGEKLGSSRATDALARLFGKWITWHAPTAKALLFASLAVVVAKRSSNSSSTLPSQSCFAVNVELWGSGVQICDSLSVSSVDTVAELRRKIALAWRHVAPSSIRIFVEKDIPEGMGELVDADETLEQAGIGEGSKIAVSTRRLELKGHTQPLSSACVAADGSIVATASRDRSVVLWSLKNGERLGQFHFDAPVLAVLPLTDSKVIALLGNRQAAVVSQADGAKRLPCSSSASRSRVATTKMATLQFGDDQCLVCVGDRWTHLTFLSIMRVGAASAASTPEASNQRDVIPASAALSGLSLLQLDSTTACLAVACREQGFILFDFDLQRAGSSWSFDLKRRCSMSVDDDATDVSFGHSASCAFLVTSTMNSTARLWRWKTGAFHALLRGHKAPVLRCCFTSCDKMVVTGAANGCVRLWKADSAEPLRSLRSHSRAVVGLFCAADDSDSEFCSKHEDALGLRGELVVTASSDKSTIVQPLLVPLQP